MPWGVIHHRAYKAPACDSPRAKANAITLLVGARSVDNFTAEGLARQFNLKVATAEALLELEVRRRG